MNTPKSARQTTIFWPVVMVSALSIYCGCARGRPDTPQTAPADSKISFQAATLEGTTSLDAIVIQVVRDYHITNNIPMPKSIVIRERRAANWIVRTCFDYVEPIHIVDTNTMRIIKSGYW